MRLSTRLVLFGLGLVVLTSAAVGWQLTRASATDLRRDLEARGLAVARGVAVRAAEPVLTGDRGSAQAVLDALWEEDDVSTVVLADIGGRLIADRDFGLPPADGPGAQVIYPIVGPPDAEGYRDSIGTVRLRLSAQGLEARRARNTRTALKTSLGVAAIGAALAAAVGVALALPLRRLQSATARFADGDYADAVDQIPAGGAQEVRHLGAAFRDAVRAVDEREEALRAINQQLRDTEAARDAVTHMVIHDLKGPIGNVISLLAVVQGNQHSPEDRALISDVRDRCRALLQTIGVQLDAARLAGGQVDVQRQSVEVGELLLGAMDQVRSLVQAADFEVRFELPDEDIDVCVDRALMERAVVNLLLNAVNHGASPITLGVRGGAEVVISISDAGPGVAVDQETAVFERYTSGEASTGSGLGLALVKLAAEAHGGTATVRGSTFMIRVPT